MKYKLQVGMNDYLEVTDKGFKLSNEAIYKNKRYD